MLSGNLRLKWGADYGVRLQVDILQDQESTTQVYTAPFILFMVCHVSEILSLAALNQPLGSWDSSLS